MNKNIKEDNPTTILKEPDEINPLITVKEVIVKHMGNSFWRSLDGFEKIKMMLACHEYAIAIRNHEAEQRRKRNEAYK